MKIPQKALQAGVQQLTSPDINRPLKLGQALGQVAMQAGSAIDAHKKAEDELALQEKINAFNSEYAGVSSELNNKKVYDINNEEVFNSGLRDQIIAAEDLDKDAVDAEGRLTVPAYMVNQYLHDQYLDNRLPDFYKGLNKKDVIRFDKAVGKSTGETTMALIKSGFNQKNLINAARYGSLIDESKNSFDKERTLELIESAYSVGALTPEQYQDNLDTYEGDIESGLAQKLLMSNDPNKISAAEAFASSDITKMTKEQQWDVFTKGEQQSKKIQKDFKDAKTVKSKKVLIDVMHDLASTGQMIEYEDLKRLKADTDPQDYLTLLKANAAIQNKSLTESDKASISFLEAGIAGLGLPDTGNNLSSRRNSVINQISMAVGIDPATNQAREDGVPPKITGADAARLFALVNTVQETPYKNPDLELSIKRGWKYLTGASKETIVQLEGNSPSVINALEFETAMLAASREPNFNPNKWFESNVPHYETIRVKENKENLINSRLEVYQVKSSNGLVDWTKTIAEIKTARKKGMPDNIFIPMMKVVSSEREKTETILRQREEREAANNE